MRPPPRAAATVPSRGFATAAEGRAARGSGERVTHWTASRQLPSCPHGGGAPASRYVPIRDGVADPTRAGRGRAGRGARPRLADRRPAAPPGGGLARLGDRRRATRDAPHGAAKRRPDVGPDRLPRLALGAYRYVREADGMPWPSFPEWLGRLARDAVLAAYGDPGSAAASYEPDCALINYYDETAKMGMHRDREELVDAPVVSLSIGAACTFRFGNTVNRKAPYTDVELRSATCSCSAAVAIRLPRGRPAGPARHRRSGARAERRPDQLHDPGHRPVAASAPAERCRCRATLRRAAPRRAAPRRAAPRRQSRRTERRP